MPAHRIGVQSDPDFKRIYRRSTTSNIKATNRPSAKYFDGFITPLEHPFEKKTAEVKSETLVTVRLPREKHRKTINLNLSISIIKQRIVFAIGASLLVIGIFSTTVSIKQNNTSAEQVKKLVGASNTESASTPPSEEKPKAPLSTYKVAPNLPAIISIQKIKVEARVKPIGVDGANKLIAPSNIYDTGWYNASAKPGDGGSSGAMVISGHVHGPTVPGIFKDLKNLNPGDVIQIKRGDGKLLKYKVVKQSSVPVDSFDMTSVLASVQPGLPGLNLITCAGDYDESGHYEKRLIIYSIQI